MGPRSSTWRPWEGTPPSAPPIHHELRKMAALRAALSAFLCLYTLAAAQRDARDDGYFSKLAGPPSEFMDFKIPSPVSAAASSQAFRLPTAQLTVTASHWSHPLPVDEAEILTIIILYNGPEIADVRVSAKDPFGNLVHPTFEVDEDFGINDNKYPSKSIAFEKPAVGEWTVMLDLLNTHSNLSVPVYTIASFYGSNYQVWGTVTDESLVVGEHITVEAMIPIPTSMDSRDNLKPVPTLGTVKDAVLTITQPNGVEFSEQMQDAENDGLFQATFRALQSGAFNARVDVLGSGASGQSFVRTLWYLFHVADPVLSILPQPAHAEMAYHKVMDTNVVYIFVPVLWDNMADNVFRGFAEVWGTDVKGDIVPVAWVSGLLPVKEKAGYNTTTTSYFLQFDLDESWLDKAQAEPPLYLKNVTFDERASFITLAFAKSLKVVTSDHKLLARKPRKQVTEITHEMRNGYNPYRYLKQNSSETGKLVLVHGYCVHEIPFALEDFTDFEVFEDFDKNRANDEFAQKISEFADSKGITRFSVYSHSQGGFASLHLYTYYQTGLSNSAGGRRLQSVGTPYQGTNIAGLIADVGKLLGLLCGSNDDMTYDSAQRWLDKIPKEKQQDLYYYVTQYGDGGLFGSYCIWGAGAILGHPNDGLVSTSKTSIPYGNAMPVYKGECHSVGMHYPPQCKDSERNKEVNKEAAR